MTSWDNCVPANVGVEWWQEWLLCSVWFLIQQTFIITTRLVITRFIFTVEGCSTRNIFIFKCRRDKLYILTIEIYCDIFIAFDTLFKSSLSWYSIEQESPGDCETHLCVYLIFCFFDGFFSALQIEDIS